MDTGVAGVIGGGDGELAGESDEELVRLYRTGTTDALAELMRRYKGELFHYLVRFLGSRAAADDTFQETFVQIDVDKRFKPWLFTIGANKARDYLRRNRRHRAMPLQASLDGSGEGASFVDLMEADLPLPTEIADQAETAELVRGVVDQMPDHLREVLLLAYFQRMAYKEIAEVLEIPLGTVKSRLHSAVGTFGQLWKSRFSQADADAGEASPDRGASG